MKTRNTFQRLLRVCAVPATLLVALSAQAQSFTAENANELSTALDANGDGRTDVLVVTRGSGMRQLGLQQADGTLAWLEPESVGLDAISCLSAGRFLAGSPADGFVVGARTWNRVHLIRSATHAPQLLAPAGLGPSLAVAVDVTGAGNDPAIDDLAIASSENGAPVPHQLGAFRWDGANISGTTGAGGGELRRGNRVRFTTGSTWRLGALRERDGAHEFVVFGCDASGCAELQRVESLPAGCDYAWGNFGGSSFARFLFFVPGSPILRVVPAVALGGGAFGFGAMTSFDLGAAIEGVATLPRTGGALLVVTMADGGLVAIYDFDGTNAPVLRQTLAAAAGKRFSAVVTLGSGDFALLNSATAANSLSRAWERWNYSGATHALAGGGALPGSSTALQGAGNVLVFTADPAATPAATLREVLRAAEWSVASTIGGGVLTVETRRFVDAASGLGSPANRVFGGGFAASDHAAVNQGSPAVSVFAFAPPLGVPVEQVKFFPAPGSYTLLPGRKLGVSLAGSAPGTIHFRRAADEAWQIYSATTPIELTLSTTLEAYLETDRPSPLSVAAYAIVAAPPVAAPAGVDADLDGMADAWELQFALHAPEDDADGDGLTNRDECFAGTDPHDAFAAPAPTNLANVLLAARASPASPGGPAIEILWPASVLGAGLETSTNLATWVRLSSGIETVGGERRYRHSPVAGEVRRYFRLARLP